VDKGVYLGLAVQKFDKWLNNKGLLGENAKSFALITWGFWDLQIMLPTQLRSLKIEKPTYFNQWMDLKKIFGNYYKVKSGGLKAAVSYLNLEFVGRQRSGLVDASNTASIAIKMIQDGCILELTDSLSIQNQPVPAGQKLVQATLTTLAKPIQVQYKDRKPCRCGNNKLVQKKVVKNSGPHNGRGYYACKICNFFEWHVNEK